MVHVSYVQFSIVYEHFESVGNCAVSNKCSKLSLLPVLFEVFTSSDELGFSYSKLFLMHEFSKSLSETDDCSGPCFIEYIDSMLPSFSRDYEGPVRVIIADKYSVSVFLLIIHLFPSY